MGITRTSGAETFTANGAVITSGKPIRVYSATWVSGATAGILQLYNGTAISGTPWISETGTAQRSKTVNFTNGLLFNAGCYVDIDAAASNTSVAILECSLEL